MGDARRRVAETRRRLYLHGPQWTRGKGEGGEPRLRAVLLPDPPVEPAFGDFRRFL